MGHTLYMYYTYDGVSNTHALVASKLVPGPVAEMKQQLKST